MTADAQRERKKIGRPAKSPDGQPRITHSMRLRGTTRERLIEAAQKERRSISEEIEYRIDRSFLDERIVEVYEDLDQKYKLLKYQTSDSGKDELKSIVEAAVAPAIEQISQAIDQLTQAMEHARLVKPARSPIKTE